MSISTELSIDKYSFKKGWGQVPNAKMKEVRIKLMQGLDINHSNFYNRLNGITEPKVSEAAIIEEIFNQYGITEIWGK